MMNLTDPHADQPVLTAGAPLERALAAMVMVHGRGASAEDILSLADEFSQPGIAYLAPQAAQYTWYPNRFLDPTASNQPWLDSALAFLKRVLENVNEAGIPPERTFLLGFSQGACLVLEYAARNARHYAGLVGLSGALIGGDDEIRTDHGNLEGTPVFLGCSDIDPHIPLYRFEQAASTLGAFGAQVTRRVYPGMGHTVNQDEMDFVYQMLNEKSRKTEPD